MIGNFIIENATVTFNDATKYGFNSKKCHKINRPYVFTVAYENDGYILLQGIQGFETKEVIEPKSLKEYEEGLSNPVNPYFLDPYGDIFDYLELSELDLIGYYQNVHDEQVKHKYQENEKFDISLFKKDNNVWNEIELKLDELYQKRLQRWDYLGCGIVSKE